MPMEDGFAPEHPLPLFLSERADEPERQGRAPISSLVLKTTILVITATAIGIAILSMGNPLTLFADVTASLVDISALQPRTDQPEPAIQVADIQALPPSAGEAPTRDEIAAAAEPDQSRNEIRQPPAGALFEQFQAWAAEQDAQAQVRPMQPVQDAPAQVRPVQSGQDAPAQVAEDDQAPVRPAHRHRKVRAVQNARAEIRPVQHAGARVRREQNAQAQVRPVQNARAPDPPVQNAQAPSFLQSLGLRN